MVARNRVVLSGTLAVTETWSTSFHFTTPTGGVVSGSTSLQGWATDIAAGIQEAMGGNVLNFLSGEGRITQVDCYQYGATGPAVAVGSAQATAIAGSGSAKLPFQTCCVFTLRAAVAGASFRGRNYWPAIGATMTTTGLFALGSETIPTPQRFSELLAFIAGAAGEGIELEPVIYSPTRDLVTPVTSIEVDTVPDIQRRRADALVGARTNAPYPPS